MVLGIYYFLYTVNVGEKVGEVILVKENEVVPRTTIQVHQFYVNCSVLQGVLVHKA